MRFPARRTTSSRRTTTTKPLFPAAPALKASSKTPGAPQLVGNRANWLAMEVPYFDHYLKGIGKPFPKVSVQRNDDAHLARFSVIAPYPLTEVEVYWAKAYPSEIADRFSISSQSGTGTPNGSHFRREGRRPVSFEVKLPAEAIEWFALVSDDRPVTVSSDLIRVASPASSSHRMYPP